MLLVAPHSVNQSLSSGPRVTRFRPLPETLESVIAPTGAAAGAAVAGLTPANAAVIAVASSRQFRTTFMNASNPAAIIGL
jgi:hypothetical protein